MEVKSGYRHTEVGIIPKEWDIREFGNQFSISAGGDVNPKLSSSEQDAVHRFPIYSNALTNNGLYGYCSYADHPAGSITITARGALGVATYRDHKYTAIGRVLVLEPKHESAGCFFAEFINSRVRFAIESTGVPQLTAPQISGYRLAVPPPTEQHAIATALSDIDALLGGLDRLIAKKRNLKQAAMQQLLTGRIRLPGFNGEWKVKRLGEALTIYHGKSQREVAVADGPYPILATGGQIGTASRPLYDKPSVLIGRKGTIDQPQYMETPFWTVDTLFYSSMENSNDAKFFYYRFCLIDWMQFNEASGVPSLNARTIEQIEVACPEPTEQLAITAVLSDMDAELEALETRRDKTSALKQAMMQELLTGCIRLVPTGDAHA